MPKVFLLVAVIFMAACSPQDRAETSADAKRLGNDIARDAKKADAVVSKEVKDAGHRVKRDLDDAKK